MSIPGSPRPAFCVFSRSAIAVDNAEIETKSDQRKGGHPEGPIGPIQKHANILQHFLRLKNRACKQPRLRLLQELWQLGNASAHTSIAPEDSSSHSSTRSSNVGELRHAMTS